MRPYQDRGLNQSYDEYLGGVRRQVYNVPTGGGKTRIAANIPARFGMKPWEQLLFAVPYEELAWQTVDAFREEAPHLNVEVEKAEHRANPDADVIVASVPTLGRKGSDRIKKFDPSAVKYLVLDECHGAVTGMYRSMLDYFTDLELLVGMSATLQRADGIGLETIFDKVTFQVGLEELMKTGVDIHGSLYPYLSPPRYHRISTEIDMTEVRSRKGDYLERELSTALDTPERNRLVVQEYLERGDGLPAICFSIDVAHAHHIVESFTEFGIPAAVVHGEMGRDQRQRLYEAYREGLLRALVSCQALSVGFDMPRATVALMARPTRSSLFYQQCLGRVFRPFPSPEAYLAMLDRGRHPEWVKRYSIVLDFCDLCSTHAPQSLPTLFGLPPEFDTAGEDVIKTVEEVRQIAAKQPLLEMQACRSLSDVRKQVESIDIFRPPTIRKDVQKISRYTWMEIFSGVLQLQVGAGALEVRENNLGKYEVWRSQDGKRALIGERPDLRSAICAADEHVPREQVVLLDAKSRWRQEHPTKPQCTKLWHEDPEVRKRFKSGAELYRHAEAEFKKGNKQFSKGAISKMIDRRTALAAVAAD